jgi:hypothetical protein
VAEEQETSRNSVTQPFAFGLIGRPRSEWKDNIKTDFKGRDGR